MEIFAYPNTNDQFLPIPFSFIISCTAPRVALSVTCQFTTEFLDAAMAALPLDNILMLTAPDLTRLNEQFWHAHAPRWSLLEYVKLAPRAARGLREMILQDNGGHENPLLPSLINLALYENTLTLPRTLRLRDALMRRVDQGVPLETLDLRTCNTDYRVAVELLSEIVVHVWVRKAYPGPLITDGSDDSGAEDFSDSDDESEPRGSSDDDSGGDEEEIDDEEEEDYEVTDGD